MTLGAHIRRLEQRVVTVPASLPSKPELAFDFDAFAVAYESYTAGLDEATLCEWARRAEEAIAAVDRARERMV